MELSRRKELYKYLSSQNIKPNGSYASLADSLAFDKLLMTVFGLIEDGYDEEVVLSTLLNFVDEWDHLRIMAFEQQYNDLKEKFGLNRVEGSHSFSLDWVISKLTASEPIKKTIQDDTATVSPQKIDKRTDKALFYSQSLLVLELLAEQDIIPNWRQNDIVLLSMIVGQPKPKNLYQKNSYNSIIKKIESNNENVRAQYKDMVKDVSDMFEKVYDNSDKMKKVKDRIDQLRATYTD